MRIAAFCFVCGVCQMIANEIPIRIYSIDHTGPNSQLGGFHVGLTTDGNHVFTDETVPRLLSMPRVTHNMEQTTIFWNNVLMKFYHFTDTKLDLKTNLNWVLFIYYLNLILNYLIIPFW